MKQIPLIVTVFPTRTGNSKYVANISSPQLIQVSVRSMYSKLSEIGKERTVAGPGWTHRWCTSCSAKGIAG